MTPERLRALLAEVAGGTVAVEEAERRLAWAPVEDLDFARVDHHRALRQGFPEVVFGAGKTPEQLVGIAERIAARGEGVLATRVAVEAEEPLRRALPGIEINPLGRTAWLPAQHPAERKARGTILIVTAGTSDLPVAEEAAVTARAFGNPVERLTDVGVAGIHRVLAARDVLGSAAVVIVVAGMEGALPSVVGGLVSVPVIAVPTSVGYGAAFGGLSALLGMLN
ncbi:MAG TPA: nickel pincer cofactor biosynthesis protein LarB, partial [Longimicrobium sp.]|nr:nickel pincer cofactor biosynthesis protein LarB [Longimicrobium sp.]